MESLADIRVCRVGKHQQVTIRAVAVRRGNVEEDGGWFIFLSGDHAAVWLTIDRTGSHTENRR